MGSISIRGVDDQLAGLLKSQAKAANTSVNQLVIDALKKHVGLEKEKKFTRQHHDIDQLFGKWTEDEFNKIQEKIDSERQIDQDLWK